MQHSASLLFFRRYIRTLPSAWLTLNLDSSLNSNERRRLRVKCKWRRAQNSFAARWRWVRSCPVYGRRERIGTRCYLRWFMIVWAWTRKRLAVTVACRKRLRRCVNVITRSVRRVVARARPVLGRSLTSPVVFLFRRLWIVRLEQLRLRVTSIIFYPARSIPIVWFLSASLRPCITTTEIDHKRIFFLLFLLTNLGFTVDFERLAEQRGAVQGAKQVKAFFPFSGF